MSENPVVSLTCLSCIHREVCSRWQSLRRKIDYFTAELEDTEPRILKISFDLYCTFSEGR